MTRTLAALLFFAAPAHAETVHLSNYPTDTSDTAEVTVESPYVFTVTYRNSRHQASVAGSWPMPGTACTLRVSQTAGPELARLSCPPDWTVEPSGNVFVEDGADVVFVAERGAS